MSIDVATLMRHYTVKNVSHTSAIISSSVYVRVTTSTFAKGNDVKIFLYVCPHPDFFPDV